jgi:integrase/recombinase XerD
MAHLIRKTVATTKNGKPIRKESPYWYIRYRDLDGRWKDKKAYKDKTASNQKMAELTRKIELGESGCADRFEQHRHCPLAAHLKDFKQSLANKGNTVKHAELTYTRAKAIADDCSFALMADIRPTPIEQCLADRRKAGLSVQTSNFYLQAIKQFCVWMVSDQRMGESPIQYMRGLNVKANKQRKRRALTLDEVEKLMSATVAGKNHHKMTGPERALLYWCALGTGLRAGELASLKWQSLNLSGAEPAIILNAGDSKRRTEDFIPIREDLAELLRQWKKEQKAKPDDLVFPRFNKREGSRVIKKDVKAAGIRDKDKNGQTVDFHGLRHTFISNLTCGGVNPKVAQMLARHSTITLTMDRYAHTCLGDQRSALDVLPKLPTQEPQDVESRVPVVSKEDTNTTVKKTPTKTTIKLPQKLPNTAYLARQSMSLTGSTKGHSRSQKRDAVVERKSLIQKNMGVSGQPETPIVFGSKRRGRDSNPRYNLKVVRRFSKPLPSATRPPLHRGPGSLHR